MSLNIALFNALSGLRVNQSAIDVTAQNVANVNTEGYSRKDVQQESVIYGGLGAGVEIASISREVNDFLVRDMRTALTQYEQSSVKDELFGRMEDLFGALGSDSTPSALIADLGARIQAWSVTPENQSLRTEIVAKAQFLAERMNQTASTLQSLRQEADKNIADAVTEINGALQTIAELNTQIASNLEMGRPTSDLQDRRDLALNTVTKHMNVNYFTRDNGEIVILTNTGRPVLDRTPVQLTHAAASNFSSSLVYDGGAGAIDGIELNGIDITSEITRGGIAGLVEMRDEILPELNSQLEELAQSLHDEMNALHNQGTAFPGRQTMTGTRSFAASDPPIWTGSFRMTVTDTDGVVVETQDFDLSSYATMGALVTALDGMTNVSASIDSNGNLAISTSAPNRLSMNEMTSAVTVGSETMGFSTFAGLNDLFTGGSSYATYTSSQQGSRTAALGLSGTLTISGAFGSAGIAYATGDSLQDVAAAINADGTLSAAGISATAIADGNGYRLQITDDGGDSLFMSDSGTLATDLSIKARNGGVLPTIAVRSDIRSNPALLSHAASSSAVGLVVGDVAITPGDASVAQLLSNKFSEQINFDATGMLGTGPRNFADYAAEIVALNAGQANTVADARDARQFLYEDLKISVSSTSGVNLDQEMAKMISLQNAYAASARVVTVTSELFDMLQNIVR